MRDRCFRVRRAWGKVIFLFAAGMFLAACTTTTITPQVVNAPSRDYDKVVIGDITAADQLWETRLPYLRRGLAAQLREDAEFTEVLDPAPDAVPEDAIIISGEVSEVEKGSKALRFIIGLGAGRAKAAGMFSIHDARGTLLARFESRKAYSGGAGIGGFDMLDMDEIMEELGKETALSIIRWAKGEPLEPPQKE
jgi:uncharacterized protein DUF4410